MRYERIRIPSIHKHIGYYRYTHVCFLCKGQEDPYYPYLLYFPAQDCLGAVLYRICQRWFAENLFQFCSAAAGAERLLRSRRSASTALQGRAAEGNPGKNHALCPVPRAQRIKIKNSSANFICSLEFCFLSVIFENQFRKLAKKWRERRDSNPQHPP